MERVSLFNKKNLFDIIKYEFCVVGLSPWWDRPHDAFHMVVDLCQVFASCSTRWWESEIAWLINHEEGRWASHCWKLKAYNSMGSSPNSANKIWETIKERTLRWDKYVFSRHSPKPFNKSFSSHLPKFQSHMWKSLFCKTFGSWAFGAQWPLISCNIMCNQVWTCSSSEL